MFELAKQFHFEAGHLLTHHDGKCARPHGHSYFFTVKLASPTLISSGPKTHMVMDFSELGVIVKKMIATYLDHHWLNHTLETDSPTAEYIAKWIFDHLKPQLPMLQSITLNETATSSVSYFEE